MDVVIVLAGKAKRRLTVERHVAGKNVNKMMGHIGEVFIKHGD